MSSQHHALLNAETEECAARAVLPGPVFTFLHGAAHHGQTKARNEAGWDSVTLTPRLPVDVSGRTTKARMFGHPITAPIAAAPVGQPAQVAPGGDMAIAEACAATGVPYVIPTMASETLETVAAVPGLVSAFQLYWLRDAARRWELADRAEQAGCSALVVTVDAPGRLGSYEESWIGYDPTSADGARLANLADGDTGSIDPSLSWDDIAALADHVHIPVYVKGVLSAGVAQQAHEHGAAGVVVSNHGGRQLDAAPSTAEALPGVAADTPPVVLADSGIRSGTDVLRALALGAEGVLVGRHLMYGLAAGGRRGVADVLDRLTRELDGAMANTGCVTVDDAVGLAWGD